jgi:two-component system, chemotaxis family, CheB/CheR fusion protein
VPDIRNFDEELLRRIIAHLRVRTGHDFSKYKRSTVLRRIARRMQVARADELKEYYHVMRDSPDEAQTLLGDLLISVTTFFRLMKLSAYGFQVAPLEKKLTRSQF